MGVDSRSKGRGFESQPRYWMDMTFFTFICCKNCIVCLKRPKINKKRGRVGPIFNTFELKLRILGITCSILVITSSYLGNKKIFERTGANLIEKLDFWVITILRNNALWLVEIHHVTSNSQSKCWISEYSYYSNLKFIYEIGSSSLFVLPWPYVKITLAFLTKYYVYFYVYVTSLS